VGTASTCGVIIVSLPANWTGQWWSVVLVSLAEVVTVAGGDSGQSVVRSDDRSYDVFYHTIFMVGCAGCTPGDRCVYG